MSVGTTISIVVWCIVSLTCIGSIIAIIGNVILFRSSRDSAFIKNRFGGVVFALNSSIFVGMMASMLHIYAVSIEHHTLDRVFLCIYFASWFSMFLFLNIKTFMTHFRHQWQYYMLQAKWQEIINPQFVEELKQKNWYIRNRQKWDKLSNVALVSSVSHLLNLALCVGLVFLRDLIHPSASSLNAAFSLGYFVQFIIPCIIFIAIVYNTPHLDDQFFIHWESRIEVALSTILIVLFLAETILVSVHYELRNVLNICFSATRIATLFTWLCVSTFVIRHKYDKEMARQHSSGFTLSERESLKPAPRRSFPRLSFTKAVSSKSTTASPSGASAAGSAAGGATPQVEPMKVDPVLRHPETVNLFMQALAKEYSMEVLLSYIEFDQYERYIMKLKNQVTISATMHTLRLPTIHSQNSTMHSTLHSTFHSTMNSTMHSSMHSTMHTTKRGDFPEIQEGDVLDEEEPDMDADPDEIWAKHVVLSAHSIELVQDVPDIETMDTMRNVPKSIIVQDAASSLKGGNADEQTLHDVKKKAHLLFNKYIKPGSEFEINIQWQTRKYLMSVLENKQELYHGERGKKLKLAELAMLFHEAKEEMKMLLSFSWTRMRFHSPSEYNQCVSILNGKDEAKLRPSFTSCL